ncbi:MAG: acyltransferase [Acidobacteriota bacterium]|nr:acyltransferase [Acidobacteriota bacterium]
MAVMAFHAGIPWAAGGQLGVDVFFVLSGFLVTSLLLAEYRVEGTIRFGRFWVRRARRLLPALLVLLLVLCAYARWAPSGLSPGLIRSNSLATLCYVANWDYILTAQNYFTAFGTASPLLHTWSLAVEEQFYLVWPVIALLALRRWGRRGLGWAAAGLGLTSAGLCGALYLGGVSETALYYGTDTRAQSLMVGAVLAAVLDPAGRRLASAAPRGGRLIGLTATAAALGLLYCFHSLDGRQPLLYLGGFLLVALMTAAVITLVVLCPAHPLTRLLAWGPARHIGRISYGLYLYHWPLFWLLTVDRTGLHGEALLAVRLAATLAVAEASYHLIERPVRAWQPPTARPARITQLAARSGFVAAPLGVVAVLLAVTSTPAASAAAIAPPPGPGYVAAGGATRADPQRVMVIGDSLALTLGAGLLVDSGAWGVTIANDGALGCDLDPQSTVDMKGVVSRAAQGCPNWRTVFARLVERTNPDLVVVLLGRWETIDRFYGGRWTSVGSPAFDQHLREELSQLIDVVSARGAEVVFLTLPYVADTTTLPDGSPWDINLPSRTDAFNADVRSAVAAHRGVASVIDLNRMVDPSGHYQTFIGPVRIRSYDKEHFALSGGMYLRPTLLPVLARLGAPHYQARHPRPSS